jgi:tetratricopeptide (TPR) repeat protein
MDTRYAVIALLILITAGCAGPGRESFETARKLDAQNRFEDALSMYEDAVSKEAGNAEYRSGLEKVRKQLASGYISAANRQLEKMPATYDLLRSAQSSIDKALRTDPESSEAKTASARIKSEMDRMVKKASDSYSQGTRALESRDWRTALERFREIRTYYPGYLDLPNKIAATESGAAAFYLKEAENARKEDNVEALVASLESALVFQPGNSQLASLLKETKEKNTASVNLAKASTLAAEGRWEKAGVYLKRASALNPTQAEKDRIASLYSTGGANLMDKAVAAIASRHIYTAYLNVMSAFEFSPSSFNTPKADAIRGNLITAIMAQVDPLDTAGHTGLALYWAECAYKVSGPNKDVQARVRGLKDKLKQRVVKKIAIMDFNPPGNNADAGRLVTDSLLSYMTRNAGGDVKILARDVLGALIKEIEMGQAGLYDIESAKKSGKLKGTDVFIFGSLLQYNVEKNVEEGQKTVIAKVGVDRQPNPEYTVWANANPNAAAGARGNAPPAFIERDRTETIRYKVAAHRKTAFVTISFRGIDVESGEVVITKTLKSRKEATGTYSEGVDVAGIPYQKLELPSDNDLLEKAVEEAISDLGQQVLSRFQNLQESYLNSAEMLKKRGDNDAALEKYMDAVMTEEVKNIKSPVSEAARKGIDRLLKQSENHQG